MCDITNNQRRATYKELRKVYSPSFSRRARDFNLTALKKKHKIEIPLCGDMTKTEKSGKIRDDYGRGKGRIIPKCEKVEV